MRGALLRNLKAVDDPKTVEEWEAVLMPWLNALSRAALHCKIHSWASASDIGNLWLAFRVEAPFRSTDEAWLRCMEGMELLELVARVDKRLAWDLLINRTVWTPNEWLRVRHNEIPVLPRFKLLIDDCKALANDEDVIFQRLLAMNKPLTSHSATYVTVKEKLLAKWARAHGGKAFDRVKEGRVEVVVSLPVPEKTEGESTVTDNVFAKIEELVAAHASSGETIVASEDGEANPLSLSFVAPTKGLDPTSNANLSSTMGMPIICLEFRTLDTAQLDTKLWSDFLKNHIMSLQGSGTQQLSFDTQGINGGGKETLCLAVAHSRSLREVEVTFHCWENNSEQFLWLMYALFSKESDHDIHTVGFNIEALETSYIEATQAFFDHDDPLAWLYEYIQADESTCHRLHQRWC